MEGNLKLITPSELHSLLFTLSLSLSPSIILFSMAQATKPYIFPPESFLRRIGALQPPRWWSPAGAFQRQLNIEYFHCVLYMYIEWWIWIMSLPALAVRERPKGSRPFCVVWVGRKFGSALRETSSKVKPLPHRRSQMKANSIQPRNTRERERERERKTVYGGCCRF
jgi:hypothetical protein